MFLTTALPAEPGSSETPLGSCQPQALALVWMLGRSDCRAALACVGPGASPVCAASHLVVIGPLLLPVPVVVWAGQGEGRLF